MAMNCNTTVKYIMNETKNDLPPPGIRSRGLKC